MVSKKVVFMNVYCVTEICMVFLEKEAIWMGAYFGLKPIYSF